ncbi:MAG: glycosyltransferase involved in cell wall biosynthesis [Saprospiraceae bacterium]|jgi:glycosyltransferase involved in cell wall biosynthesis
MTFDLTIPVLNEEETLDQQVRILHTFLSQNFPDKSQWKIIIADNGSTDRTEKIANNLSTELLEVKLVKVPKRGVGLALKTSWEQSKADIVGYMDLDLATDLSHFLEAFQAIQKENYDLVYATRLHKDSQVIGRTLKREISSQGFNFILKSYLNVNFSDGMCGFKWLKREVYPSLKAAGADNDGWFFSTELLTTAEWEGLKIKELPVKWTDDAGSSKVEILPLAKKYLKAMQDLKKKKL